MKKSQSAQFTVTFSPREEKDRCLYPIVVNGNSYWCDKHKFHDGHHTAEGGYFQIQWRSGLIV